VLISVDPRKRAKTLPERSLDFPAPREVFASVHRSRADERRNYGDEQFIIAGWLDARIVVIFWTPRGRIRSVISMRKANVRGVKALALRPASLRADSRTARLIQVTDPGALNAKAKNAATPRKANATR